MTLLTSCRTQQLRGWVCLLTALSPAITCGEDEQRAKPMPDYALEFSGEACVIIPKLRYDGSHPITVEAIVKPAAPDPKAVRSSAVANVQLSGVGILFSGNRFAFLVNAGRDATVGYAGAVMDEDVELHQAVHVAGVFDGRHVKLFVDGKRQADEDTVSQGHFPSPYDFMIGADPNGKGKPHQFFRGTIDEVRISKTARYSEDFTPQKRFQPDGDTLVLYHLDEGQGLVANDASENELHAEIRGARWVELGP